MKLLRRFGFLLATLCVTLPAWTFAQETPVGLWKTIDDTSGKPRALVRITEINGTLQGRIEKLFLDPDEPQNSKCVACTDARKDQPIVGLTIVSGLRKETDAPVWSGGEILDPKNGKIYKSKATLIDGGKKLDVRGYIGIALIGRTQTWVREQERMVESH